MNRREKEKNIRKIFRQGKTSLAVTLPIEMAVGLRWRDGQKVKMIKKGRSLIIRDWAPPK